MLAYQLALGKTWIFDPYNIAELTVPETLPLPAISCN